MTKRQTDLEWLQSWYERQCDGEWEHQHGIAVDTLDNPGWSVRIDLAGTNLENISFDEISELDSDSDWIHCVVTGSTWHGRAGPLGLSTILRAFRSWAGEECAE